MVKKTNICLKIILSCRPNIVELFTKAIKQSNTLDVLKLSLKHICLDVLLINYLIFY